LVRSHVRDFTSRDLTNACGFAKHGLRATGLTRQTIYRIKDDPAGAEAALATWGA
jgi:hypothetical protein